MEQKIKTPSNAAAMAASAEKAVAQKKYSSETETNEGGDLDGQK